MDVSPTRRGQLETLRLPLLDDPAAIEILPGGQGDADAMSEVTVSLTDVSLTATSRTFRTLGEDA